MAKIDKEPAPIVAVLVQPMEARLYLGPIQKSQHRLLQRAGALAGDDLHFGRMLGDCFVNDIQKRLLDSLRIAENWM